MDARTLVTNITSILSLPDVVVQINDLINDGKATNAELEEVILNPDFPLDKIPNGSH